jgi:hypothetical protein
VTFLEAWARPLLVLHGVCAAVLVAASTHHLLWTRRYRRGSFDKMAGERTFALLASTAFLVTFLLGNLLYPTYKVRVRAEYLDSPAALTEELKLRATQRLGTHEESPAPRPRSLASVARVFDIKEHWVALGCAASLALFALSRFAHPKEHPDVLPLYLGLSIVQCSTAWLGAIIGLVTASYRSVGGPL